MATCMLAMIRSYQGPNWLLGADKAQCVLNMTSVILSAWYRVATWGVCPGVYLLCSLGRVAASVLDGL